MDFNWITPAKSGNGGKNAGKGARVAIYRAGRGRPQLSIALYIDTMKKMRWVAGDRVQVGFCEETRCIALRRVPSGGYALAPMSVVKSEREKAKGTTHSSVVKLTAPDEIFPLFSGKRHISPDDCVDLDGTLVLSASGDSEAITA